MTEQNIHFYTLNVGQGDSHVIYFPASEAAILIDPGNGTLINELLHQRLQIKSLPFILITHGDMDHMAGINEVIKKCLMGKQGQPIKPGYIFFNDEGLSKSSKKPKIKILFKRLREIVEKYDLKLKCIYAEDDTSELLSSILNRLGIAGKIIYPKRLHMIDVYLEENYNLASVSMLLTFANQKILYTGDLPYAGWEEIDEKEDLKSDVFKVPHHGGWISDSSGKDMKAILNRVKPNFALVSVGSDNTHKHPLREVISAIVTHPSAPYLLCTQMTGQCSGNRFQLKEKIDAFYRSKIKEEEELDILRLGEEKGTGCAGTIRVTFNKDSDIAMLPSLQHHSLMLKTIFNDDGLLCRPGM